MTSEIDMGGYNPRDLCVIRHGSKDVKIREFQKDGDFGKRKGGIRKIEFDVPAESAVQWHVHSAMDEEFISNIGTLSILLITGTEDQVPKIERHNLSSGKSLEIKANTPHLVFNDTGEQISSFAIQTITEPNGKTIRFNLT